MPARAGQGSGARGTGGQLNPAAPRARLAHSRRCAQAPSSAARRRFDEGGEQSSNAAAVAQVREGMKRGRGPEDAASPPTAAAAAKTGEGGASLRSRAKMLQEQRQQVPLRERRTTNATATQREAMRKQAYAHFTEGGGSVFLNAGAVPHELVAAKEKEAREEEEAKQRRRAALATLSADDANVFLSHSNMPSVMAKAGGAEGQRHSDSAILAPTALTGRENRRRRLSSLSRNGGSGGGGGGSVAERAKAMQQARGGGRTRPPESPDAGAARTASAASIARTASIQEVRGKQRLPCSICFCFFRKSIADFDLSGCAAGDSRSVGCVRQQSARRRRKRWRLQQWRRTWRRRGRSWQRSLRNSRPRSSRGRSQRQLRILASSELWTEQEC